MTRHLLSLNSRKSLFLSLLLMLSYFLSFSQGSPGKVKGPANIPLISNTIAPNIPSVCVSDQTVGDFSLGTPDANTFISSAGDGEVDLKPAIYEEFSGNSLPAGWGAGVYNAGSTTFGNGMVTVDGTHIFSTNTLSVGSALEFTATFNLGSFQNVGFSDDQAFSTTPWVTIGQGNNPDGNLYARAFDGTTVSLGSNLLGAPHKFKIKWNAGSFDFYVDGNSSPSATINIVVGSPMFVQISDFPTLDGTLSVDIVKATPYASSGSFLSKVFDAGSQKNWGITTWNEDNPPTTTLSIYVRAGETPVPDASWTPFKKVIGSGSNAGVTGQYIQYRADLSTTDNCVTPALKGLSIECNCSDLTAPVITTKNITVQGDANGVATITPSDIIASITDNTVVDPLSVTISQSQFSCKDQFQAYVANTNMGNQVWFGTLGMEFRVVNSTGITINQLGAFDHQGDGIHGTQNGGVRVSIWDKSTLTIVPGLDAYIIGQSDHYVNYHRMKDIPPVVLPPGDYVVVTLGYNAGEMSGNSSGILGFPPGDLGKGAISYIGTSRYKGDDDSTDYSFPNVPDELSNQYLAGTFSYFTGGPGEGGDNIVTVSAKDYCGNLGQATAKVTLVCNVAPIVTTPPADQKVCDGTTVTFTSAATGTPTPTVQWQVSTDGTTWTNIAGATNGTLSFTATFADNGKQYRAVWCNIQSCVNSAPATLTVYPIPSAGITSSTTILTCATPSIIVTATGGGTYKWEDNSTSATRTLTAAGTYTVTVTGTGGCTATKSITITSNKTAPVINPLSCGTLSCTTTSVSVTATATGQGILSYVWSGGTQGASPNIRIFTVAGNYSVTVTDAANGCSSIAYVNVSSSVNVPVAGITNNSGTTVLTCTTSSISVTATGGGTYKWEDNSTSATRTLTAAGTYTVTVTGTGGCTASKSITITSNKTAPVINPLSCGTLSCTTTSVSVTATATGQGTLSYVWSGGTQGASPNIRIFTVAGNYSVTVTDAANGCSSIAYVNVSSSVNVPVAGITNNSGTTVLTCTTSSISVTATGGGTYKWEDNSTSATRTLTAAGTYTVTVTGTGGCTASKSITITSNKTAPVINPLSCGTLSCTTTSVSVTATATGQGILSYVWSGGTQGASSNIRIFTVAGNYSVTVTDAANGCSSIAYVNVSSSVNVPVAGITNNSGTTVLTCTTSSISVTATGGGTYKWEDNSTSATRTLTAAGTYTVTVTGTGGCTATKSITITSNKTAPVINPLSCGTLSCTTTSVSVTATATGQGTLSYVWSGGTQGASPNIRIFTVAGNYSVTVTDAANGCSSIAYVTVNGSSVLPTLTSPLYPTATSEILFTYTATSSLAGTTFSWIRAAVAGISNSAASGSGNVINETLVNTTKSPINVTYVFTLKYNGCTNTQNVVVKVNPSPVTCVTTSCISSSYYACAVPAGKYLWIYSVFNPYKLGSSGKVNFYIYNSKVTYNGNNGLVTINLPYSHIVFDPAASSASTKFVNNVWETVVPFSFSKNAFMNGISYPVPAGGINGGMKYATWTADIAVDKPGVELNWKTTFSQYSSLADNAGLNIKPVDGPYQNPYANNDLAGTPENYCSYYNSNNCYSDCKTVYCNCSSYSSRGVADDETVTKADTKTEKLSVKVMPNPSTTFFTLAINGSDKNPVMVRVSDELGRVIDVREKVALNTTLRLGQSWTQGVYFAEITQGKEKVIVRMVKSK